MGSPPLLDFTALLAPIPGDSPAGSSVSFDLREKLEEARKEDDPDAFAPDDPMRPEKLKKADWKAIIRLAQDILTTKSKDLLVAARLTEALVKEHGYAGLRDGLHLLREMVGSCWDRIQPEIEDGDLEVRATAFNWLDDPDRGARFPTTLRLVPIVPSENGAYTYMDWRRSQDGTGEVSRDDFEKALFAAPQEKVQHSVDDLSQAREELKQLLDTLNTKMQQAAPALTGLRQAVEECGTLLRQMVALKGGASGGDAVATDGTAAATTAGPARSAGSRAEIYRQLGQLAGTLQQLEPHSPIPYLIKRAVELGNLSFPELIKELVRDANVLSDVQRIVGIKEKHE
jgi:type VI secretion system protein ImpA